MELFSHLAWQFLDTFSRYQLLRAFPIMAPYTRLHRFARHEKQRRLREPQQRPESFTGLQRQRSTNMGTALIKFVC
jgi:hypothetical protein